MINHIHREQLLDCSLEEAWKFFATPRNLDQMTPESIGFKITHLDADEMHQGQMIAYKIKVAPFIWLSWLTEITFIDDRKSFIDDQRSGPYKVWHHTHRFEEKDGKTLMIDDVTYVMPFGIFGKLANILYVKRQVKQIFDERQKLSAEIFNNRSQKS